MSFAKGQELLKLAMMATGGIGVSLEDIVEEWRCSHRTAQRMTDALQTAFPQTEVEDGDDRKRRWRIHARAIAPLLTPSAQELAALATAITALESEQMTAEAATLRDLQLKVLALLPPGTGTRLAVDEEALLEALRLLLQGRAVLRGPFAAPRRSFR